MCGEVMGEGEREIRWESRRDSLIYKRHALFNATRRDQFVRVVDASVARSATVAQLEALVHVFCYDGEYTYPVTND